MPTTSKTDTLTRLQIHLARVTKRLSEDFRAATEKHSGTPESVANSREKALREVIKRFFPNPFKVAKGGIYDSYGNRSVSIDCVICAPNHPYLIDETGEIEIILVDGVYAALELKPNLTDLPDNFGENRKSPPEIIRALNQAQSVKGLERERAAFMQGNPSSEKQDYGKRCPTYIISDNSAAISQLGKYIADYYIYKKIPPSLQLDVVFVLNNGLIFNNKAPDFTMTKPISNNWFPHLVCYDSTEDFITHFYLRLVSEIGPELSMSKAVLKRYLDQLVVRDGRPKASVGFNTVKID